MSGTFCQFLKCKFSFLDVYRGARHGLKLSGKLKRIQEQEELEGYLNRQKDQAQSTKPSPPSLDKDQSHTTEDDDNDGGKVRDAGDEEKRERKRQKKEKKRRMKAAIENGQCDDAGDEHDGENVLQESGSATEEEKHTTEQVTMAVHTADHSFEYKYYHGIAAKTLKVVMSITSLRLPSNVDLSNSEGPVLLIRPVDKEIPSMVAKAALAAGGKSAKASGSSSATSGKRSAPTKDVGDEKALAKKYKHLYN